MIYNNFIWLLGSDYQHNFSHKILKIIETIRLPDNRGLNHLDSLSHILKIQRKMFPHLFNLEVSGLASLKIP